MGNGAGRFIHLFEMAVVGLCVRDDLRHSRPIYRSGDALIPGHRCARRHGLLTDGMIEHESAILSVGQQHGAIFRIHDIQRDVKRLFQQVLEFDVLREDL